MWKVWSEKSLWLLLSTQAEALFANKTLSCSSWRQWNLGAAIGPCSRLATFERRGTLLHEAVASPSSVRPMPKRSRRFGAAASLRAGKLIETRSLIPLRKEDNARSFGSTLLEQIHRLGRDNSTADMRDRWYYHRVLWNCSIRPITTAALAQHHSFGLTSMLDKVLPKKA